MSCLRLTGPDSVNKTQKTNDIVSLAEFKNFRCPLLEIAATRSQNRKTDKTPLFFCLFVILISAGFLPLGLSSRTLASSASL
ncbi:hypothetical protein CCACVL1_18838 [Corchorus capsularis]|uniref:Uncharacterized protein n=1 Tax=Corchorus capsularis TaxID=210143 RepID=A0A1R3HJM1_COCAP|nr:hypothetical protein CCACVL1_18838 [Corchorus capsularis]